MPQTIRVLIVEDNPNDTEFMVRELERSGFLPNWTRVETEEDYLAGLHPALDVILCDYRLPQFTGLRALELLKQRRLSIPFFIVSGTIGEETAVEAMKLGADDYLLKDRLGRLGQAVAHALAERLLRDQHRLSEAALQSSEAKFRSYVEFAPVAMLVSDRQGHCIDFNRAAVELLGYQPAQLANMTIGSIHYDEDRAPFLRAFFALQEKGRIEGEFRLRRADGQRIWVELRAALLSDGRSMAFFHDITTSKAGEEELRWKTAFLEAQVNASPDGILVVSPERKIILRNQRFLDVWKTPAGPGWQENYEDILRHCANQVKDKEGYLSKIHHLYSHPDEAGYDEIELKDGRWLYRYSSSVLGRGGQNYGRIWTFRDVTERRSLESQLRQAQKMEAIGQLSSGVAHDFNNLLAVIQGNASLLLLPDVDPVEIAESADQIVQASERAASLTRQLLLFSRKQSMQPHLLDLNQVVGGMTKMLGRILGDNIALVSNLAPDLPPVHADPGMIEQVLLNLAVNSRDAMAEGGKLLITTGALIVGDGQARHNPEAAVGPCVYFCIEDTGCGIAAEHLPRIFEPFFTTKEAGKGTGLGLATVYGIVKQHGGWITVESKAEGAAFHVYLPVTQGSPVKAGAAPPLPALPSGTETILLVEDESSLRFLLANLLERSGYTVLQAASGVAALKLWQEHKEEIRLVLTDIVMPGGVNGRQLADQLLSERPGLKIMFASGYSSDVIGKGLALVEGVNFLQKPFNLQKLAQTIRAMLDTA